MICPMMSRPIKHTTYQNDGTDEVYQDIFFVDCQKEKCALWERITSYKKEEIGRCGLIQKGR